MTTRVFTKAPATLPLMVKAALPAIPVVGALPGIKHARGTVPDVVLEGAEMDAVLRFVERGLGVAIVPAMVLIDRPALRSVRLGAPALDTKTRKAPHRGGAPFVWPIEGQEMLNRCIARLASVMLLDSDGYAANTRETWSTVRRRSTAIASG